MYGYRSVNGSGTEGKEIWGHELSHRVFTVCDVGWEVASFKSV